MKTQILVTLDLDPDVQPGQFAPDEAMIQASAVQAVRNALDTGEQNGFSHDLENVVSIHVQVVEPFISQGTTSR